MLGRVFAVAKTTAHKQNAQFGSCQFPRSKSVQVSPRSHSHRRAELMSTQHGSHLLGNLTFPGYGTFCWWRKGWMLALILESDWVFLMASPPRLGKEQAFFFCFFSNIGPSKVMGIRVNVRWCFESLVGYTRSTHISKATHGLVSPVCCALKVLWNLRGSSALPGSFDSQLPCICPFLLAQLVPCLGSTLSRILLGTVLKVEGGRLDFVSGFFLRTKKTESLARLGDTCHACNASA